MSNFDGAWNCTVSSPMGPQTSTMTLKTEGDRVTGTNSGQLGTIDIEDGKVDDDTLTYKMSIKVPMPLTLDCKATVDGDSLTGTVSAGAFGSWPMTGTRA